MSKENCSLIKDLLPLYIDDLCSKESTEIIKNHLNICPSCRKEYEQLTNQPEIKALNNDSTELIKGVGNMFKKDKKKAIIKTVSVFLVVLVLLGVFAFLKVPLMLYKIEFDKGRYSGVTDTCQVFESGDNTKSNYSNEYFDLYIDADIGEYKEKKREKTYILDFGKGKNIVLYDENQGVPIPTLDEHKKYFNQSLKYPIVYAFTKKGIENYGYSTEFAVPYNYKMLKDFISSDPPETKILCSFEDYTKACAYYSSMAISVLPMGNGNSHYIVSENDRAVAQGHYILSEDNNETYLLFFQSKEDLSKIYAIKLAGFTEEEAQEIFKYAVIR